MPCKLLSLTSRSLTSGLAKDQGMMRVLLLHNSLCKLTILSFFTLTNCKQQENEGFCSHREVTHFSAFWLSSLHRRSIFSICCVFCDHWPLWISLVNWLKNKRKEYILCCKPTVFVRLIIKQTLKKNNCEEKVSVDSALFPVSRFLPWFSTPNKLCYSMFY